MMLEVVPYRGPDPFIFLTLAPPFANVENLSLDFRYKNVTNLPVCLTDTPVSFYYLAVREIQYL